MCHSRLCRPTARSVKRSVRRRRTRGLWLVDPVNGATARWGLGPVCKVRVTHLADDATAIGFSWHHAIGDMQTLMHFMNAWSAAAADKPLAEPLIVEDRAAYLDEHLPADGAREPGVRCLGLAEFARSALYLAKDARKQRTLSLYFGEDEIARMRDAYGSRMRLSANDVVCAHVSEALMKADPAVDRRTLAIAVNARNRCGLDPMLVGNIITTLNLDLRRGETASSIAERIRHNVDHFADEHCDMRINQQFLDAAGAWRARSLCIHCLRSGPVEPAYHEPEWLRRLPHPIRRHLHVLLHAVDEVTRCGTRCPGGRGRWPWTGLSDVIAAQGIRGHVEPREFGNTCTGFGSAGDDIPRLHREVQHGVNWFAAPRPSPAAAHGSRDTPRRPGRVMNTAATRSAAATGSTPHSILMP